MTMPHLMNCDHSEDGWCLDCVKTLHDKKEFVDAENKVKAAILGLFAAINICRKEGYDVYAVLKMVETQCEEWGVLVEDKQ